MTYICDKKERATEVMSWGKDHLVNGDVKYLFGKVWNMLSEFTEDTILGSVKQSIKKQVKDKVRKN